MTCEEVTDKEGDIRYQRKAGFLLVDGEAALEEVNMVKTSEITAFGDGPICRLVSDRYRLRHG